MRKIADRLDAVGPDEETSLLMDGKVYRFSAADFRRMADEMEKLEEPD